MSVIWAFALLVFVCRGFGWAHRDFDARRSQAEKWPPENDVWQNCGEGRQRVPMSTRHIYQYNYKSKMDTLFRIKYYQLILTYFHEKIVGSYRCLIMYPQFLEFESMCCVEFVWSHSRTLQKNVTFIYSTEKGMNSLLIFARQLSKAAAIYYN